MFGNINFKRFDRSSDMPGFDYKHEASAKDYESNPHVISMENPGFNLNISILNYMAEAVMLGANVRSVPTRINSLLNDAIRLRNDQRNSVIIRIHSSENKVAANGKTRTTQVSKSEIRIPGHMLNQGSVFIDELDCYITTESNLEATRELIARDVFDRPEQNTINLPASLVTPDPAVTYQQYKLLSDFCIRRQDEINIRVGYDVRYGVVPDIIKKMHVAILDHYFVPFTYHKLVFDPTLGVDEFVIENLHLASNQEFRYTFTELAKLGAVYLDHEQQRTMFGDFYGLALFADAARYASYVHERKSIERFNDEILFVTERSGDPRLREEIGHLNRELASLRITQQEKDEELTRLQADKKRLTADVQEREKTITKIQNRHEAHMSAEVVLRGMENEESKIKTDQMKIENDHRDQRFRAETAKLSQKAAILKAIGDILKSGWGIATACTAGVLAFIALLKKYNVKITMSG